MINGPYTLRDLADMELSGWPSEVSEFQQRAKSQGWGGEPYAEYHLADLPVDLRNKVREVEILNLSQRMKMTIGIFRSALFVASDTMQFVLDKEDSSISETSLSVLRQTKLVVDAAIEGAEDV